MTQDIDYKKFFEDCFNTRTPVFIITKSENWISGYLNSLPTDLYVEVLDWREVEITRVMFSNIHARKEFSGDYSKLPLPKYMEKKQ